MDLQIPEIKLGTGEPPGDPKLLFLVASFVIQLPRTPKRKPPQQKKYATATEVLEFNLFRQLNPFHFFFC
jgi:hypothetical protein